MIDQMPLDVIDNIVSHTDVHSIPYLKATCKTVSNEIKADCYDKLVAQHIRKKLEDVINVVKQYHETITNKDVEENLFKMMSFQLGRKIYVRGLSIMKSTWNFVLFHVSINTKIPIRRISETWKRYVDNIQLQDDDIDVLNAIKNFVIGTDNSIYVVSFNFIDKQSKTKTHYCVINLKFHNGGDVKLAFSIENFKSKPMYERSVKRTETYVSDATLTDLSECIVEELGRKICLSEVQVVSNIEKWIRPLTKYHEKLFDDTIDILVNPESYREKITKILL